MAILTAEQMLEKGLRRLGVTPQEQQGRKEHTNVEDFAAHFGPSPDVASKLWEILQTTDIVEARIDPKKHYCRDFLTALHWLKRYPTEKERKIQLKVGEKTGRKWSWFYAEKIGALKSQLITWPDEWRSIFTITVDGVHFRIQEPNHPEYKVDPKYFSHKFGSAGLDYEIGISIFEQRVVWVRGPFKAGRGDLQIFRNEGLMAKIPHGKKVVADKGYRGQYDVISIANSLDSEEVREFKTRALARHENFNFRLERYAVLRQLFRNSHEKHGMVFNAVAVISCSAIVTRSMEWSSMLLQLSASLS